MHPIHEKALATAARFKQAEADLIAVLQEVEVERVFMELGYPSLFVYCVQALGLSEAGSANFITVARKAREVPVLQAAIQDGALSVSKARKITPVLTLANQEEWIEKAMSLSTRKLEEEVALVAPRAAVPERLKVISEDRSELKLGISQALREKLERIRDLESQRTARAVSLEETLEGLAEIYLEAKDPVRRADRVLKRKETMEVPVRRDAIPALIRHQVQLRDGGRCAHVDTRGSRCENRRWLDLHHIRRRSQGGVNSLENLTTLCSAHHRMEHRTG